MCQTIKVKVVTLRKRRYCFGCRKLWEVGHSMSTHVTRGDGRIYTLYLCGSCQEEYWENFDFFVNRRF